MEFTDSKTTQYNVVARKSGYMYKYAYINVPAATTKKKQMRTQVRMDQIREGYSTILRNIYFDFDKAVLKKESYNELENLLQVLQQNPGYIIEIAGHTDNIGTPEFNKNLSLRRAQAVVKYLTDKGQSKDRFIDE
jgi:outer membrane protein OmpA-like peptidoglycan-associated protein